MKNLLCILALFLCAGAFAQQDAWVYFSGKQNVQDYIDNPLQMLSQRALDRRAAQNIALDEKDVPIPPAYIDAVEAASGISVMAKSKWLNAVHVRGSVANINALAGLPFVASVDFADDSLDPDPGRISKKKKTALPRKNSAVAGRAMNVQADFNYGTSANQIQMLNGHVLHAQDHTGQGKIIAVLDAGFPNVDSAQPFQRLWDNNLILGGYNFVDRNSDIFSRNNHGTLVLSTMGGYKDGQLVGTAPDSQYYLFITEAFEYENPLEESLWVEAAEVADSLGVDVINSSLGYVDFDNPAYDYTYEKRDGTHAFITRGADIAFTRGMVVVVSAGNDGQADDNFISAPADGFNVLAVGAVTPNENYASFSSIGPSADGRVKPDVVAQGQSAVVSNQNGNITASSGTSFSGPIIAGMVATLWSAVPELTNQQIVDLIKQSADSFANPTALKGYGVPDFSIALQNALSVSSPKPKNISVWPNPVSNSINLKIPDGTGPVTLEVFDSLGQVVLKSGFDLEQPSLDCSGLASGVYVYSLSTSAGRHTGKFIKI